MTSTASDTRVTARLPAEKGSARLLRTPLGGAVARPWFDRTALWALSRWVFPPSRQWAAARAAEGSVDRFYAAVPVAPRPRDRAKLERALAKFEAARASALAAETVWQEALFAPERPGDALLVAAEQGRRDARHRYNATRRHFRFLARREVPLVKRAVPSPSDAAAAYGEGIDDPVTPFALPDPLPAIEASHKVPGEVGDHYWLRFPSPSARLGDEVYARVLEPHGASDPPTLIFGHGVCVEFDHWHGLVDEIEALVRLGFRVVRPEAPWHGRRVPPGRYGGEELVATIPLGALDLFVGAVREWGVLMDWCRANTNAPVAIGGCSLGALTAQLAADRARAWPDRLRPDALFLVTHCGRLEEAVLRGSIGRLWRLREAAEAAGWTEELLGRYLPLLAPTAGPVVPAERIVSILGTRDTVTPYDSGKALVDGWGLPPENLFLWDRGHFSVPLTLMRNHAPLHRLEAIVASVPLRRNSAGV